MLSSNCHEEHHLSDEQEAGGRRTTDGPELLAFVYWDRDQHYFISTCSTLQAVIRFSMFGCGSWNLSKQTKDPT
jgi:hypothetical protein